VDGLQRTFGQHSLRDFVGFSEVLWTWLRLALSPRWQRGEARLNAQSRRPWIPWLAPSLPSLQAGEKQEVWKADVTNAVSRWKGLFLW